MRTLGLIGPMNEREAIEFERRFVAPATRLAPPEVVGTFADTEPAPPPSEPPPPIEIPRVGIVRGLSAALYHADPCDTPSLSSSIAKVLHAQSPAHAWAAHPKLGRLPRPPSATLDDGQILHAIVLGREDLDLEIVEADNFKTKAAQHARDAGRAEGRTPITRRAFDRMTEIAELFIRPQLPEAFQRIDPLDTEVSIFWDEAGSRCRARVDLLDWEGPGATADIFDLKGTTNAHPDKVTRAVDDYGYAIQEAAYLSAWAAVFGASAPVTFTFLFIEHAPPYVVTPVKLSEAWRTVGRQRWERAVELWSQCLARGTGRDAWPAYGPSTVTPPSWVISRELGIGRDDREVA